MANRTCLPLADSLPALLRERKLSLCALARELEISDSHLSRAVRGVDSKRLSPALLGAIADLLGVPADYFPEYREHIALATVKRDAATRDWLYDSLPEAEKRRTKTYLLGC